MEVKIGNVLAEKQGIIVHGCNTEGVMGAGIALTIKSQFPAAFAAYLLGLQRPKGVKKEAMLGTISVYQASEDLFIVNAITQTLSGARPARYDAIHDCFEKISEMAHVENMARMLEGKGPLPVIFPAIAADRGGCKWGIVSAIIDNVLEPKIKRTLYVLDQAALTRFTGQLTP